MKAMIVAMSVLALAAVASAEVGDLEYVQSGAADAAAGGASLQANPYSFTKPAEGSGCVHPQAVVATIGLLRASTRGGVGNVCVAVDSRKADAKAPDVLRFDFSGKGKFDDKAVVDVKLEAGEDGMSRGKFGPATLTVTRDDQPIKVVVSGEYFKRDLYRALSLNVGCTLGGKCAFGDKTYPVRLVDANGSLSVTDPITPARSEGQVFIGIPGDEIRIDTGDGTFKKDVHLFSFGQPISLDGKLWTLTVSDDRKKVSAKPAEGKFGYVRLPAAGASCTLVGDDLGIKVSGDKPVAVPPGKYLVMAYLEGPAPGSKGEAATLMVNSWMVKDDPSKRIEVSADKTIDLKVGAPLTAKAGVPAKVRPGSSVQLSLVLTDQGGNDVSSVSVPGGARPPKPRVDILNDKGEKVYSSTLEYG